MFTSPRIIPLGKHINSQHPLLQEVRKAVRTGHAHVARRRRQMTRYSWIARRTPQAHGRHVMSRPTNPVRRRHILYCLRRKGLPIKRHPHDLRIIIRPKVLSRPIYCSQYSGVRLRRRADSGAPTYSSNRGSWIPYAGLKSEWLFSSS